MLTTREMVNLERDNIARMRVWTGPLRSHCFRAGDRAHAEKLGAPERQPAHGCGRDSHEPGSGDRFAGNCRRRQDHFTRGHPRSRRTARLPRSKVSPRLPAQRSNLKKRESTAHTLQHHLASGQKADDGQRRLYFVDESSLASTKQVNEFLTRLNAPRPRDLRRRHAPAPGSRSRKAVRAVAAGRNAHGPA